jgi:GNAT superfamily N-acetyltransferase
MAPPPVSIRTLTRLGRDERDALARVLVDCVEGGASVSFMLPLGLEHARAFWEKVGLGVEAGERAVLVAEDAEGICGTVQLILGLPDNQPHRADVAKMLVHRRARRRGVGEALLLAAEAEARRRGRTLLVLDTVTGSDASRLYERLGWIRSGDVPKYALWPGGGYCSTTFYYRDLSA